ncbi:MAG: citrate synthase [Thermoplasmata archaeon]|jgi:citrate synthase|nr:citrate synthase [Thermoplasmata archaeon]
MPESKAAVGLDGVVAAQTRLSLVDGQNGVLVIAGFPVEELAPKASFEEVVFLLWNDRLPTERELAALRLELAGLRQLPLATARLLRDAAAQKAPVIDALRMAASTLSLQAHGETASNDPQRDAKALIARFPVIVAAYWRLLEGQEPIPADANLHHAANFLYMLTGKVPSAERARALETYLNTVSDHGFNASTFTCRVIVSTQSDMVSAVTGAIGALKGPLHGGAPGPALDMVFEIGTTDRAESVLREKIRRGERLMGFGHRVYKVRDPRADVLNAAAEKLYRGDADRKLYDLATQVEKVALRVLEEEKPGRNLKTNVEFYTALVLHGIELPTDLFTPCFAIGRVAGWTAHGFEQQALGKLIRPQSEYVGPRDRRYTSVDRR